jgi:MFS family permease
VITLDAATVLLQWAVGGLFFLWVTSRRREVGIGYGWTMRITFGLMAVGAVVVGLLVDPVPVREAFGIGVVVAAGVALVVSWQRRKAGVAGQRSEEERRSTRVAEMTGIDKDAQRFDRNVPEFPPGLDLLAPVLGLVALVAAGIDAGDPVLLALARTLVGALFLGAVSDAMLLGHWYLVQPGLARAPIIELVRWTAILWPFELLVLLWPTGMLSVLSGTIDDGYGGMLGWYWVASTVATILLVGATRVTLRERQYSAVMAATGLLYLAILTAFGMDLVARATLA